MNKYTCEDSEEINYVKTPNGKYILVSDKNKGGWVEDSYGKFTYVSGPGGWIPRNEKFPNSSSEMYTYVSNDGNWIKKGTKYEWKPKSHL